MLSNCVKKYELKILSEFEINYMGEWVDGKAQVKNCAGWVSRWKVESMDGCMVFVRDKYRALDGWMEGWMDGFHARKN